MYLQQIFTVKEAHNLSIVSFSYIELETPLRLCIFIYYLLICVLSMYITCINIRLGFPTYVLRFEH